MGRQYRRYIVAVALACLASIGFADHYVAQNGQTPVSPYTSWDSAASNIQQAVGAAAAGATVWVTNGPYLAMPGSNSVVYISKGLKLRGNSTQPNAVVLDGGGTARGIHIVLAAATEVLVDGFCITNCKVASVGGAGIYLVHSSISTGTGVVQNCVIRQNEATVGWGGGLFTDGKDINSVFYTLVSNCVVSGNIAGNGGGITLDATRGDVRQCRIDGNYATNIGGGVYVQSVNAYFHKSSLESNTCGNTVDLGGGGAYLGSSLQVVLDDCVIGQNESLFGHGGGLYARTSFSLTNCTLRGNKAVLAGKGWGGGICTHSTVPYASLYNCLLTGNAGQLSGGLYALNNSTGTYTVVNCTVVSNEAFQGSGGGIGVPGTNANVEVRNSIVYGNVRLGSLTHASANYSFSDGLGLKRFYQSDALPFPTTYDGGGNISSDPQFAAAATGNYRLAGRSPCINTGSNQVWMAGALDLDGKSRIDPGTGLVDMGCFEYLYPGGTMVMLR
jgi:hypothetical protein